MQRIQGLELLDYPWIPSSLRRAAMAYLRFAIQVSGQAKTLAPKLAEALATTGERNVVDLCSGDGGPWLVLAPALKERGVLDHVTLSDLFPDSEVFADIEREAPGLVGGTPESVDAGAVPPGVKGLRTLFNAFHHFAPDRARKVLQDAVDARAPIAVFEVPSREPIPLLCSLVMLPWLVFLSVPFLRPFRWSWLLWTYALPALPLLIAFDGFMSCLRVYSVPELRGLVSTLRDPGYRWEMGRIRLGTAFVHATFLVGHPPRPATSVQPATE